MAAARRDFDLSEQNYNWGIINYPLEQEEPLENLGDEVNPVYELSSVLGLDHRGIIKLIGSGACVRDANGGIVNLCDVIVRWTKEEEEEEEEDSKYREIFPRAVHLISLLKKCKLYLVSVADLEKLLDDELIGQNPEAKDYVLWALHVKRYGEPVDRSSSRRRRRRRRREEEEELSLEYDVNELSNRDTERAFSLRNRAIQLNNGPFKMKYESYILDNIAYLTQDSIKSLDHITLKDLIRGARSRIDKSNDRYSSVESRTTQLVSLVRTWTFGNVETRQSRLPHLASLLQECELHLASKRCILDLRRDEHVVNNEEVKQYVNWALKVHRYTPHPRNPIDLYDCYFFSHPCGSGCDCCSFMLATRFVAGTDIPLKDEITCLTENVIYLISCRSCPAQYVGQTYGPLKVRFYQERNEVARNKGGFLYVDHFRRSCRVDDMVLQGIERVDKKRSKTENKKELDKREGFWMWLLGSICTQYGLNKHVRQKPRYLRGAVPPDDIDQPEELLERLRRKNWGRTGGKRANDGYYRKQIPD